MFNAPPAVVCSMPALPPWFPCPSSLSSHAVNASAPRATTPPTLSLSQSVHLGSRDSAPGWLSCSRYSRSKSACEGLVMALILTAVYGLDKAGSPHLRSCNRAELAQNLH